MPETKPSLSARISAALRRLERVLDSFWVFVASTFSKCLAPLHKFINFIGPKHNTENKRTERQTRPAATSNVVPTTPTDYQGEECRYRDDPWWKTTAEMFGIAAVVAYTVFSGFQMHYARQQRDASNTAAQAATATLNTMKAQFQMDQRPEISIVSLWLVSSQDKRIPQPIARKPVIVTIQIKNVGKSPALRIVLHRHVVFDLGAIRFEAPDTSEGDMTLEQGMDNITTAVSMVDTYKYESIVFPTSEQLRWDGKSGIFVFGRISYEDRLGERYCLPFLAAPAIGGGGNIDWARIGTFKQQGRERRTTEFCPSEK